MGAYDGGRTDIMHEQGHVYQKCWKMGTAATQTKTYNCCHVKIAMREVVIDCEVCDILKLQL